MVDLANIVDLFNGTDFSWYLRTMKQRAISSIDALPEEQFLGIDQDNFLSEFLITPVQFFSEKKELSEPEEIQIPISDYGRTTNVRGFRISAFIPFTGNRMLFNCIPSSRRMVKITADIDDNEIVLHYSFRLGDEDRILPALDRDMDNIQFALNSVNSMAEQHNIEIRQLVADAIDDRKKRLATKESIAQSFGVPIRRKKVSFSYPIPDIKRKLRPQQVASRSPQTSTKEWGIPQEEYEYILSALRNMTYAMERSPATFSKLQEEEIRDFFLVNLNGHYEGRASGETFNCNGKTDILIQYDGRSAFIAECKFWSGPEKFIETLDQLTERYLTWRNSKAAVLIFNRNKNFTAVLEQLPTLCRNYKYFLKEVSQTGYETEFRFIASHKDDPAQEITITVMAFDIPQD